MSLGLPEHLDLCAAFAAGSLDAGERKRFAQHLAEGCDECERALPNHERATVLLAAALPLSAPGPGVKERVLSAAASPPPPPAVPAGSRSQPGAASTHSEPGPTAGTRSGPARILQFPALKGGARAVTLPTFELPPAKWAAVIGGLTLVALVALAFVVYLAGETRRLHAEVTSGTQMLTAINQQLEAEKNWSALLTSPESRFATL